MTAATLTAVAIRDDIPMPPVRTSYPWHTMNVGDSFAFPMKPESAWTVTSNATRKYAPKSFKVRKHNGEMRCWRVA